MKRLSFPFRSQDVVERVSTRSVLNPLLWLCGITLSCGFPAAYALEGLARTACIFLIFAVVSSTISAYFVMLFKEPDRLQSEDYQLKWKQFQQGSKEQEVILDTEYSSEALTREIPYEEAESPDDLLLPSQLGSGGS
jgi:hypothetical protein